MHKKIIKRLERTSAIPSLIDALCKRISPADLQSLLLEVFDQRSAKLAPTEVFKRYLTDRFAQPSGAGPRLMLAFDRMAMELATEFEPVELSPVAPLGSCSAVGTVSQNKIISTTRNSEVLSDSTNVMALEAAKRRQEILRSKPKSTERVRLCTSHRVVRTQPLPDPRFLPHFRLFGLVTAGRDSGDRQFEWETIREHLTFHLSLLTARDSIFQFEKMEALVTQLWPEDRTQLVESEIFAKLSVRYPHVDFRHFPERKSGRNYYQSICFQVNACNHKGIHFNLSDGGFTNWTQQFLQNKKERLLISAIGSELVCLNFVK